ncbi:glycoside hydrolase family 3 protein [Podospora appendiculata]|uniref:beta-glucosidase n=1 Tax=Podospora appendiculata TaxID=314037 RepID=A0AAE0XBV2_9PEZI|nr:glycoside hydrolase family 3 protein [Podospora appendiculata]
MAPSLARLSLAAALAATATSSVVNTPFPAGYPSPWGSGGAEGWEDAYAKAKDFVNQLTLVEKVNLTTGTGWEADVCVGMTGSVPRLGFRGFCLQDGPLGIRYSDRDLMRRRGQAMGEEFRGKGIDVQLGPVAGPLGRVPQGGRNWEGFSPDPYLTGVAMAETIQGIQSRGVIACAKHYILNEQEHYRGNVNVKIDDRTMHELYLWPFADAVRAGVGSVMCSYNKVNGEFACENEWSNNYLLKNELNFQGFVMSDWGAQKTTLSSALGGLDMAMPGDGAGPPYGSFWGGALTEAVLGGQVPEWRLDDMVIRIMAAYFKVHTGNYTYRPDINFSAWTKQATGPLHPLSNSTFTVVNEFVNVQADHGDLIREIGAKSIVLLKNENHALPLNKPKSMAVIGEDAQDIPGGPNACAERGCVKGTLAMGYGSGTAEFPYLISPATALQLQASADKTAFNNTSSNWDLGAARAAASKASVAIVFAMATSGENFIIIDGNAGDRNNLTLWNGGDDLIKAVASVNPNTIVVLHTVGPVIIDYAQEHPNITAIIWAGLPGQESGNALVDVLYGKVNPQGRSPFTWGKSVADYGAQLMFKAPNPAVPEQTFDEGIFIDYRYFDKAAVEPTYWFGFGLSYTSFDYVDLKIAVSNASSSSAASGLTAPAPTYGTVNKSAAANLLPAGFQKIRPYVYPWLNDSSATAATGTGPNISSFPAAARNGSAQPVLPAGGGAGGNPGLYDVLYMISATIKNTGEVAGTEIPQLYVQLGGEENPFGVLRGFDEIVLAPGEVKTVTFELTRRDVSNWNSTSGNWEISTKEKFVFVGSSAALIRLNSTLPAPAGMTWQGQ